jgi:hypothetical protein
MVLGKLMGILNNEQLVAAIQTTFDAAGSARP